MTKVGNVDEPRDGGSAAYERHVEPVRAHRRTDAGATLVVGGGVAGRELATKLGRASRRSTGSRSVSLDVTLVDKNLAHVWKPALHTVAAGTARLDQRRFSLLVQAKRNGFTFWPGALVGVDRRTSNVTLAPFSDLLEEPEGSAHVTLPYDVLILAMGSRANDFATPGVARYCSMIDDVARRRSSAPACVGTSS